MDKSLRTWLLTPAKDSELWSQSTYRGEVWVRAHDAVEARKLTAQEHVRSFVFVRHTMSLERSRYAKAGQEDAKGQCSRTSGDIAEDTSGVA
jgi:hypothetical protein